MRTTIAIIGSGFGGLGLAIRLLQQGRRDFLVLERAQDVGGVWRDNTYPGCACDVQSHLYSFSFAPNPAWTRWYSPQAEIKAYLRDCAARFGVLPYVRFGHEVANARWVDGLWRIETSQGLVEAEVLVNAAGALSAPSLPALPGLPAFQGKVMHSAAWDHGFALEGKRVAVVGTGASAIQFIPAIQPSVQQLVVFQRTPPWILPRRDAAISPRTRALFARLPFAQRVVRAALQAVRALNLVFFRNRSLAAVAARQSLAYLRRSVRDPVLRRKLQPRYDFGCKRVLLSDHYLPALTRDNVAVVTDAIREVRAHSVVDASGVEHEVDAIIFGTGFQVTTPPLAQHIFGPPDADHRPGRSLAETWGQSMTAHVATTVAGFPNLFIVLGPNSGLGHTSVVLMIESQLEHILGALAHLEQARTRGMVAVEPKLEAQARFVADVDKHMIGTVWTSGSCHSWYLDASGRNSTLWPGSTRAFHRRVARFDPSEYTELSATDRRARRDVPEATHV